MTQQVMEHDAHGPREAVTPIVLALNCNEAQTFLDPKNQVLTALLGEPIRRVDITVSYLYFYPGDILDDKQRFYEMLELHPDLSPNELRKQLRTTEWLIDQAKTLIWHRITEKLIWPASDPREPVVRVVLIHEDLLSKDNIARQVLEPMFGRAAFFSTKPRGGAAIPIWTSSPPRCNKCNHQMRDTGDAYVCENCDNVVLVARSGE